jgi:hypothetical protein
MQQDQIRLQFLKFHFFRLPILKTPTLAKRLRDFSRQYSWLSNTRQAFSMAFAAAVGLGWPV